MEMTHLKGKLFAGIAAVSLAACAFAAPAFAANDDDPYNRSAEATVTKAAGQIDWTAPTEIPFAAAGDGTMVTPSETALQITNNSDFAIHVTNIQFVKTEGQINLVGKNDAMTTNNSMWFTMKTGNTTIDAKNALSGIDVSSDKSFNMGYKGSSTDSIGINAEGKIAHVSLDLSTAKKVGHVVWTVKSGAAE